MYCTIATEAGTNHKQFCRSYRLVQLSGTLSARQ